jgi:hypothetical protein
MLPRMALSIDQKQNFLTLYRKTGLLNVSAKGAATCTTTILATRKADPDFDAAVNEALQDFREILEKEAFRRAVEGCPEDIIQKGECVGTRVVYSDRILELMLKRHIPAYRERQTVDMNVAGGVLVVPGTKETMDEWEQRNRSKSAPDAAA